MNATHTSRERTADVAYEENHLRAQALLARINELLFEMPAPANEEDPVHWGHVGSLAEVNSQLADIVAFLAGED